MKWNNLCWINKIDFFFWIIFHRTSNGCWFCWNALEVHARMPDTLDRDLCLFLRARVFRVSCSVRHSWSFPHQSRIESLHQTMVRSMVCYGHIRTISIWIHFCGICTQLDGLICSLILMNCCPWLKPIVWCVKCKLRWGCLSFDYWLDDIGLLMIALRQATRIFVLLKNRQFAIISTLTNFKSWPNLSSLPHWTVSNECQSQTVINGQLCVWFLYAALDQYWWFLNFLSEKESRAFSNKVIKKKESRRKSNQPIKT